MTEVRAVFPPTSASWDSNAIYDTPPLVTSTLYQLSPFLILANKVLNFVMWTSLSNTRNFVILAVVGVLILHWGPYVVFAVPVLAALFVCGVIWVVHHSYHSKFAIYKAEDELTVTQVMKLIHNFTTMCSYLFPIDSRVHFDVGAVFSLALAITPLYIYAIEHVISTRVYMLCVFVGVSTWFSSTMVVTRIMLRRWVPIRLVLGSSPANEPKFCTERSNICANDQLAQLSSIFRIHIDDAACGTCLVEFEVTENQRYWIALGWTKRSVFEGGAYTTSNPRWSWSSLGEVDCAIQERLDADFQWLDHASGWRPAKWVYPSYTATNCTTHVDLRSNIFTSGYTRSRTLKRKGLVQQ